VLVSTDRDADAFESFDRLCRMEAPNDWPILSSTELLKQPRSRELLLKKLEGLIYDPQSRPEVMEAYVLVQADGERWDECLRTLRRHVDRREHWHRGAGALLSQFGDRSLGDHSRRFVAEEGDRLRSDTSTWGQAAYALCNGKLYDRVIDWMSDWRDRSGVRPWMTLNLGFALTAFDRFAEAADVHERSLELPPDHSTPAHRVYAAACRAATGRWEAVDGHLAGIDPNTLGEGERVAYEMVRTYRQALPAEGARPGWWSALQTRLRVQKQLSDRRSTIAEVDRLDRLDRAFVARLLEAQGRKAFFGR
jgi:hypothetical protein